MTAMRGEFDLTDPFSQTLRAAWLLARLGDWCMPQNMINMRLVQSPTKTYANTESGDVSLECLNVDVRRVITDVLLDKIADEFDGDHVLAEAIGHLAGAYENLHATPPHQSTKRMRRLAHFDRLRREYDHLAQMSDRLER